MGITYSLLGCLQNPNALDSKVTVEFDHVKKGLKVDDEGVAPLLSIREKKASDFHVSPPPTLQYITVHIEMNTILFSVLQN